VRCINLIPCPPSLFDLTPLEKKKRTWMRRVQDSRTARKGNFSICNIGGKPILKPQIYTGDPEKNLIYGQPS
jgi:hypothetical protein